MFFVSSEAELLGNTAVLFKFFWELSILLSIVAAPIYIPTKGSLFPTTSPTLVISSRFDNTHSNGCEVVCHCGFYLHFWWLVIQSIFSCTCWPFNVFFGKIFISSAPFLIGLFGFLLLSHMSSLYILDISPLSDIWFANILSHSVGCLFVLLMAFFAMKNFFSLMWSYMFIFAFVLLLMSNSK